MDDLKLLGLKVRDRVTGLTGICECVTYDLYGCIQAVVRPPVLPDKAEVPEGRYFDVSRLDVVDSKPVMEIPGGRFSVMRTPNAPPLEVGRERHGAAEKPARP